MDVSVHVHKTIICFTYGIFSPSGGGVYDVLAKRILIRNQEIKGTLICGLLFFKWMGVFQSWLDCFSVGV